MSGPVSDTYDPEFSTGENASMVRDAVEAARDRLAAAIGSENLNDIVGVVRSGNGIRRSLELSERELRILWFAVNRALDSL